MTAPVYVGISEAARALGLSARSLQRRAADGAIPGAVRGPGGVWSIPLDYVDGDLWRACDSGVNAEPVLAALHDLRAEVAALRDELRTSSCGACRTRATTPSTEDP